MIFQRKFVDVASSLDVQKRLFEWWRFVLYILKWISTIDSLSLEGFSKSKLPLENDERILEKIQFDNYVISKRLHGQMKYCYHAHSDGNTRPAENNTVAGSVASVSYVFYV